jgi:large conductance mechanosensitive channel
MGFGKLWAEFKAFAFQGNMIELAVAVVIGAAFGNVVHSLVGDVIMPTVAYAIHEGETAAKTAKAAAESVASKTGITSTTAPTTEPVAGATAPATPAPPDAAAAPAAVPAPAAAAPDKPISIDFNIGPVPVGKFLTELINFVILAFAVFIMIVKLLGSVMKKMNKPDVPGEPTTRECPECLSIIPIKARRCSHCTAVIEPPVIVKPA